MAEGQYPKSDGDIFYAKDANMAYYQAALASTIVNGGVNATTSATLIKASNSSRKGILLKNHSGSTVYIGLSGVTVATGRKIEIGRSIYLNNKEAIYGITSSGTGDVRYLEAV